MNTELQGRNKDSGTRLQRYVKSFFHALDGIKYATLKEHNMIIIIFAALIATVLGFVFNISAFEWLFTVIIIGLVMAMEMINTAIEAIVDIVSPKYNELAKIAKDTASSATLILSLTALIGALIIYIPKIFF